MHADLVQALAAAEARGVHIDHEQRNALGAFAAISLRHHQHHVAGLAIGDEGLGAIDDVLVALLDRTGTD
ncbi:hypothetical protein D3C80_2144390 [compost metagenome]